MLAFPRGGQGLWGSLMLTMSKAIPKFAVAEYLLPDTNEESEATGPSPAVAFFVMLARRRELVRGWSSSISWPLQCHR